MPLLQRGRFVGQRELDGSQEGVVGRRYSRSQSHSQPTHQHLTLKPHLDPQRLEVSTVTLAIPASAVFRYLPLTSRVVPSAVVAPISGAPRARISTMAL